MILSLVLPLLLQELIHEQRLVDKRLDEEALLVLGEVAVLVVDAPRPMPFGDYS